MASFSAGTTFTDGVANDVTAAKLAALVNAATPTSGLIQDRTAETTIAADDTLLFGDFSDSNNLKRMTVANFNNVVTTGTGTAASPAIVPTGDSNTGVFFPAADTIAFSEGGAEAMRIDSSGNVGIGTTSPLEILTLNASSNATTAIRLRNQGTNVGFVSNEASLLGSGTSNNFAVSSLGATSLLLGTNGTERLRIDSSGNVGIGISSPTSPLHVYNSANSGKLINIANPNSGTGAYAGVDALSDSVSLSVRPYGSTFNTFAHAGIALAGAAEIWADTISGSGPQALLIGIATAKPLILATNNTERLRIDSSGNVGIGTTSPAVKLDVQGAISSTIASKTAKFDAVGNSIYASLNDGTKDWRVGAGISSSGLFSIRNNTDAVNAINIDSSGGVTISGLAGSGSRAVNASAAGLLSAASDASLKEEVIGAHIAGLDEILQIHPKMYRWKDDIANRGDEASVELGFIANDVAPIIPSAAPIGNDGLYGFYDRSITAALVKAVQELKSENDSLKSRIEALEAA